MCANLMLRACFQTKNIKNLDAKNLFVNCFLIQFSNMFPVKHVWKQFSNIFSVKHVWKQVW